MAEGWISIHRNIQEHWIWQDSQKLKWWLDILLLVNHKDNKFLLGNKIMELERGEHHTSEVKLSKRWGVDKKTVRSFLKLLENDKMIELKKTPRGTTLKVSNYNVYQPFSESKGTAKRTTHGTAQGTTESPLEGQLIGQQSPRQLDTNNNDNNDNNENNENKEKKNSQSTPTLSILKDHFGKVSFETWFEPNEIVETETELKIKAVNSLTKEIIENKFKEKIELLTKKKVLIKE